MKARLSRGRLHAIVAALENLDHDKETALKFRIPYTRRERELIAGALAWAREMQGRLKQRSRRKQLALEDNAE